MAERAFLIGLAIASALAGTASADVFTGPVSKYYLDDPSNNVIYVVQGPSVILTIPMQYGKGDDEGALAVTGTIRTRAGDLRGGPDSGAGEYTLNGTPTGHGYATPPSGNLRYYDGTSDGVRYNYFVDHGQADLLAGGVYRADGFWQNPELLFWPESICNEGPPGCHGLSGIAYDPYNHSLWISDRGKPWIGDYALDGTLLALFNAPPLGFMSNAGLGLDPADHTLWVTDDSSPNAVLRQYSLDPATFGDLLQSGSPAGLPPGLYDAAEFQVVSESASWVLLALILIPACGMRAGRKRGLY